MHFASPIPWWLALAAAAAIAGLAYVSYRRPPVPLSGLRRWTLTALRATAMAALVFFLCRPIVMRPPAGGEGIVVPILVDGSRSMRIADADGRPRIERAVTLLERELLPGLADGFTPELLVFGESVTPAAAPSDIGATLRQTDLAGAVAAVRDRYRGQRIAAIVVVSDGGETRAAAAPGGGGPPVFAVGVGSTEGGQDLEVTGISAGDPRLDQTSVDLRVSAVSRGFGRASLDLRVLANGRLVESRTIAPAADGAPVDETFTVSPDPLNATVYTAELAALSGEAVVENNARSVLVSPAGRRRRVLTLQGAPGYEHSFLARALAADSGLEIDSVVRKGKNDAGQNTFLVQAGGGRAESLISGFPATREALFAYDALLVANVEGDVFTRTQLALIADFVAVRGGGLLVLGGRAFSDKGLLGTPLEAVLPLELNDRRGGLVAAELGLGRPSAHHTVMVTPEGLTHPVMRIETSGDRRAAWAALPALAASAPLGGPRPGATVLAVTSTPSGAVYPLVAVQRYGSGRSMIFAGEASWRWRMLMPATDRTYEFFWRQATRWLASPSPDPVSVEVPASAEPGDRIDLVVDVRDAAFAPAANASVEATLTAPGAEPVPLATRRAVGEAARHVAAVRPDQVGLYRVRAEARQGHRSLGVADRWFYVGGSDRELSDPRLNAGVLRRLAAASGGRYFTVDEAGRLVDAIRSAAPSDTVLEQRDLWHRPWAMALVLTLLAAEWILRRRWGLR